MIESRKMSQSESEKEPAAIFICKPESGSQGKGIFISTKIEGMKNLLNKANEK